MTLMNELASPDIVLIFRIKFLLVIRKYIRYARSVPLSQNSENSTCITCKYLDVA